VSEGLILQGCGGDFADWVHGINTQLTLDGILQNGSEFTEYYTFQHDGLTNILFSMDNVDLHIGKLAAWRLQTRDMFGGTWLSDYLPNKFGIEVGKLAPKSVSEPEIPVPAYTLKASVEHPDRPDDGGFSIPLPTTPETAQVLLENLRLKDIHSVKIGEVYSTSDNDNNLSYWLNAALHDAEAPQSLDELNYLVTKICSMSEEQREVLGAALQAKWSADNIVQMINLAENLDCYSLETAAFNADIYGEFHITMAQDDLADKIKRLENASGPDDQRLVEYIERLEKCVDHSVYGEMIAEEEGGAITDYGYLQQMGEMTIKYCGIGDIPPELRLSKPSFMERLQQNVQRSQEQFDDCDPTPITDKGEHSL